MQSKISTRNRFSVWLQLFIVVVVLGLATFLYTTYFSNGMTSIAEAQLDALRQNNFEKAYLGYTSKEFQSDTSFDGFKDFVLNHPVLSDNRQVKFYEEKVNKEEGILKAYITANDGTHVPVIYKMSQENGKWKIQNMQLQESGAMLFSVDKELIAAAEEAIKKSINSPSELTSDLIKPIQAQLDAIKKDDITRAYEGYVSKDFKEATSVNAFKDFVKANAILTNYSTVNFGEGKMVGDKARISLTLISNNNISYPVNYTLVQENNAWKIYGFRVLAPSNAGKPVSEQEKQNLTAIVKQQIESLHANQIENAYNQNSSKEFKDATSLAHFTEFVKAYPELMQYQSYQFGDVTEEGDLRLVKVTLNTSKGESTADYRLIKDDNVWKIWGINITSTPSHPPITATEKSSVTMVIEEQLKALKGKDVSKAYYPLVSSDFEKATNFDQFDNFIKTYPIFMDYKKYSIVDAVQEGDLRLVRVSLENDSEVVEIDYRLIQEGDRWKIWGIQILTEPTTIKAAPHSKEDILSTIQGQLEALKANDISKAYYAFTSKEFQDSASRDLFKKFLDTHPELNQFKSVELTKADFDKDMAMITAVVTTESGTTDTIDYRLIYERDKWKIFSLQVVAEPSPKAPGKGLEISKAVIGHTVDLKGIVTDPGTVFDHDRKDITVNLYVLHGTSGTDVEVVLEHIESASSIPAVKTALQKDGDSVVSFVFTPPTQGWPVGNYKLLVRTSTGLEKNFTFQVK